MHFHNLGGGVGRVGGRRIIENTLISIQFHGLGGGVGGAGGSRIIENTFSTFSHFGSWGGPWNHFKYMDFHAI